MARGGHLAVLNSRQEFDMIRHMLMRSRAGGSTVRGFWVDGTDEFTPNDWYCATLQAGCPWLQFARVEAEPDDPTVTSNCAIVWSETSYADGPGDITCSYSDAFPICEFECE